MRISDWSSDVCSSDLAWSQETPSHWRTQLAYTWLRARYSDAFCSPLTCTGANTVLAGNAIPGVAPQSLFASFGSVPPQGWRSEGRRVGKEWDRRCNSRWLTRYSIKKHKTDEHK